jgi:hypothetical protein
LAAMYSTAHTVVLLRRGLSATFQGLRCSVGTDGTTATHTRHSCGHGMSAGVGPHRERCNGYAREV